MTRIATMSRIIMAMLPPWLAVVIPQARRVMAAPSARVRATITHIRR